MDIVPRSHHIIMELSILETAGMDSWIELTDKAENHRERLMTDEENQVPPENTVAAQAAPAALKKAASANSRKAETIRADPPKEAKPRSRGLSAEEKLEKVGQIEAQIAGGATLKDAAKRAGISDQTFYQWKKATAQPVTQAPVVFASVDDEFAEFIQLEEENRRLRKLLSEKLRAENADLRKRLGMN
jgi:putative transposase